MLTDSHCHITCDDLYENAQELISNAKKAGVDQMLVISTSLEEYQRAEKLREQYPDLIKTAFGFYPGDAQKITEQDLQDLERVCASGKLDVLGEIGLDYYWDISFKEQQKELLITQLKMAEKYDLPVSIHMREASRDTLDLLHTYAKTPVILHCFSGSLPIMEEALKMGAWISFAGPITYKNNKQGPVNAAACPMDRILSETDSPYLSPVPYRGKKNQPAYVKSTVEKIAEIKGVSIEELEDAISDNYRRIFSRQSELQS